MFINTAKNFSSLIVSQIGYKFLSFISIAYVARKIGDAKFGQLSFALYLGLLFFALADMGLSEVYICETAGNRETERKIMGISIGNRITLSLITILLVIPCALMLTTEISSIVLILLVGIAMILDSFTLFLRSVFRAREKMEYEAVSFTIEGLIKFVLLVLTVKIFKNNLLFIGFALLLTSLTTLIITILICQNKFFLVPPIINKNLFFKFFKKGLPFAIVGFLSIVSLKIDVIMLSKMSSDSVTGWYSAAVKLVESILVIPTTLSIVLFPVVSRLYKGSKESFLSVYRVSLTSCIIFGIIITFLLYFGSSFLINLIFGKGFINSVNTVRILSFVITPFFLKLFLERTSLVVGKVDILLKAYIGGVILKIILNLLFIPVINYQGAAFTTVFIEILTAVFIFYRLKRHFQVYAIESVQKNVVTARTLLHARE